MDYRNFSQKTIASGNDLKKIFQFSSTTEGNNKACFLYIAKRSDLPLRFLREQEEMHAHDFYVIGYAKEACGFYMHGSNKFCLQGHSIGFIAPHVFNKFENIEHINGVSISFSEEFISSECPSLSRVLKFDLFKCTPNLTLNAETENEVCKWIDLMYDEYQRKPLDSLVQKQRMKSLLLLLLTTITQSKEFQLLHNDEDDSIPRFVLYKDYLSLIEEHFMEWHRVKNYLAPLRTTQKTLMLCTKDNADKTPLEILNGRIMTEAKNLLSFTSKSLTEVSQILGFSNYENFCRTFKRFEKSTPREFRLQHAEA